MMALPELQSRACSLQVNNQALLRWPDNYQHQVNGSTEIKYFLNGPFFIDHGPLGALCTPLSVLHRAITKMEALGFNVSYHMICSRT